MFYIDVAITPKENTRESTKANAQIISVDVQDNRYYLVYGKKKSAVITTMSGNMFIACEIHRNAECQ